ncbi:thioredoxin [Parasulfuritortus cantonensis]|uniref:Thioredoxin n=1 Tax=Parasulfuritortus cantonensis TaxID=2528202 RepID=A0A4R1BE93_9PROT|nr:thioredoxin family protein [Parasulfuritortus cantonensis]TCJ15387.1 thioredoxin [Parasulfuritortus cantonensis]
MQRSPFQPLDEFDYHRRLAATAGPALVLFSSPTCSTCRQVERLLPGAAPDGVALFKVDARDSLALTRAFDVFHLPGLFLYRDGHYHARLDCQVTPAILRPAISRALAAPAEEEP